MRKGGQGWTDSQVVLSLVLLNLAGGDCVDDIKILEADEGFCEALKKSEMHGLRRKVRRALLRRFRKEKTRAVPSASSIFRYLAKFHDNEQEKQRCPGKAFIPAPNECLRGFACVNKELAYFSGSQGFESTATLDMEESRLPKRMKAIWFSFINLPGRVVTCSPSLIIRLTKNNPALELLINARKKIAMVQPMPSG